ncbi:DNA replication complex subunit Gins51 [Natronomonas marina]|jgi:DNA replication factor GINS|uniref:DNA replication complex subunit Gins51 n=1 Tax=Natronomonas marina TaxID=2961939 RepID=UPI0020CA03EF|nr:hypothetical protein [Natronomonas marina]
MNLDELQSVQARERQSSDLQHLRSSFYREVGEYIRELTEQRASVVEDADDPFSSPEVRKLSDDIETAEQTVEAIYERRVGKVVKKASIAAAGMPVDDDGLTDEEADLFEDLVARIEANRETVLSAMDGEGPSVSCSIDEETADAAPADPSVASDADREPPTADADDPAPEGVSAADLMGEAPEEALPESTQASGESPETVSETPAQQPPESPSDHATESATKSPAEAVAGPDRTDAPPETEPTPPATDEAPATDDTVETAEEASNGGSTTESGSDLPGMPRTTVRVTADVGEVVGADDRDYDLGAEDVVTLPEPNADVLVDKDAAERLE